LVDESEVRRAVLTFPAGSAGGSDFLRPQHIRDSMMCQESGHDFLSSLTAFINLVLSERCPSEVAPIFFGRRLLAMNKKTGGIRPIAVGFSLRRLASKCANSFGINRLREYFYPNQLGAGTLGGCEAAIHSARRYLEALTPDRVLVKLDFAVSSCWQLLLPREHELPARLEHGAELICRRPFCKQMHVVLTGKDPMDLLLFRGRAVDLLFGTSQLSLPWQTHSYVASAAREARSVAELAATKKEDKYSDLATDYLFQPIAVETHGPINESASDFFSLLAKKISQHSGDERETAFLFQQVYVLVQRFNGVLLRDSFVFEDCPE